MAAEKEPLRFNSNAISQNSSIALRSPNFQVLLANIGETNIGCKCLKEKDSLLLGCSFNICTKNYAVEEEKDMRGKGGLCYAYSF